MHLTTAYLEPPILLSVMEVKRNSIWLIECVKAPRPQIAFALNLSGCWTHLAMMHGIDLSRSSNDYTVGSVVLHWSVCDYSS